ncbi:hypothetical protein BDW22DRAFT_1336029, partial [Trametopsis cervina]
SVPQKRKSPTDDEDLDRRTHTSAPSPGESRPSEEPSDPRLPPNEYKTGRVTCEDCGKRVSFRDDVTGGFTVKHWDLHRQECPNAAQPITTVADPVMYTPETRGEPTVPTVKRRRAKRTEEERIEYLRSDPYVAKFEAYRVLCASCDKWIRLRPNSTYCSIPWDAHRKSCLSKKAAKISSSDDRSNLFSTDPQVREFDGQRVHCKSCDTWVAVAHDDNAVALQTWLTHRKACLQNRETPAPTHHSKASIPSANSVPPPSKHLMALVSASSMPAAPVPASHRPPISRHTTGSTTSTTFKDLTPSNFAPSQESRRRNAEQRAASLRADPLLRDVEANRVFCSMCEKWVQLRQDSSFCAYPWVQHRGKCMKRQERRAQKAADLAEYRAQMEALRQEEQQASHIDELESEESTSDSGAGSGREDVKSMIRARRRARKREAREMAEAERLKRVEARRQLLRQKEAALMNCSDEDAEGESDDAEEGVRFSDLESPSGRLEFVSGSTRYLFKTTYSQTDELTIAALVTYLNAAVPPDKHEDFDTTEVIKAATTLRDRGEFVFEGDVLRLP